MSLFVSTEFYVGCDSYLVANHGSGEFGSQVVISTFYSTFNLESRRSALIHWIDHFSEESNSQFDRFCDSVEIEISIDESFFCIYLYQFRTFESQRRIFFCIKEVCCLEMVIT